MIPLSWVAIESMMAELCKLRSDRLSESTLITVNLDPLQ